MVVSNDYRMFVVCYQQREGAFPNQLQLLDEAIKKNPGWAKYFETTWVIMTKESAQEIRDRLRPLISENDYLFIIETGREYSGWLPKKFWTWLRTQGRLSEDPNDD